MATKRKRTDDVGEVLRPHFGREIQRIRKESRVSQETLAREAGMDPGTLRRLEQGQTPIREDYLYSICRALEFDVADLLRNVVTSYDEDREAGRTADPDDPLLELIQKIRDKYHARARSDREFLDACLELLRYLTSRR